MLMADEQPSQPTVQRTAAGRLNFQIASLLKQTSEEDIVDLLMGPTQSMLRLADQQQQQQQQQAARQTEIS